MIEFFTIKQMASLMAMIIFCGLIGLEREYHGKDAGIRTNTLVGLGSWLFSVVSIYGFYALNDSAAGWDGSRIAAQVVSGIGFIGGGVIFFHHDMVRGLTTAAGIWVSAAVGMSCAFNLPLLALAATICYFVTVLGVAPAVHSVMQHPHTSVLRISYRDGKGSLRSILVELGRAGLVTQVFASCNVQNSGWTGATVELRVKGSIPTTVMANIGQVEGVDSVEVLHG